jgi:protein-disulfide isomerase/protein-S-isoprenylcysteine O-methyltransferase Ste14
VAVLKAFREVVRWAAVGLVVSGTLWLFIDTMTHVPGPASEGLPFWLWYGNWSGFLKVSGVFTLFLLGFTLPRKKVDWKNAGLYTTFLISLFFEMFGLPLTIFLLAPFLDLPLWAFGHMESHLWAFALAWLGILPLHLGTYAVMVLSMGLIVLGASLVAIGWATVYNGRGKLVTWGLYSLLRHPQYLGLILIVVAFNVQWPTLPTLLLGPILIVMYIRQAREEDRELGSRFGKEFHEYASRLPAFFLFWRPSNQGAAIRPSEGRKSWMIVILAAWMLAFAGVSARAASPSLSVDETLGALGNGPTLGNANAPVTIVEFSDFQCSFCRKFWADTLPKLKDTYIKQDKVRFIYRHFAILGKFSEQAAMAAECAGEQGKFWEYHDKLFANQGGLAFTEPKLNQYAQELKVNVRTFGQCLDSGRYRQKVEGETAVAISLRARGTPTFFVNGRLMVGAQPFEAFQSIVEEELRKSTSKKK